MSRQSLRDVAFEAVSDGILVLTDDGTIADCNTAAARVFDVDAEDAVGADLAEVAPDFAAVLADHGAEPPATETRDHDGGEAVGRFVGSASDGDRHYDIHTSPFETDGRTGRIVTLRDVTDRRLHRRRLSVLNRVLRHDLRNEMNVVLGYVELLEEQREPDSSEGEQSSSNRSATDASGSEWVGPKDRIQEAAYTMLDLSDQIREVEATLDTTESTVSTLDIVGLLRALTTSLEREHPNARVSLDAPESAWAAAIDLVDTAFDNLLENAVVHNHRERPTVDVTVRQEGDRVAVTVADDGPGITQQEIDTFRSDGETQLTHSSGFGLWQVIWLVEESGGDVSFDVDETGTAVTIRLPAAAPPG